MCHLTAPLPQVQWSWQSPQLPFQYHRPTWQRLWGTIGPPREKADSGWLKAYGSRCSFCYMFLQQVKQGDGTPGNSTSHTLSASPPITSYHRTEEWNGPKAMLNNRLFSVLSFLKYRGHKQSQQSIPNHLPPMPDLPLPQLIIHSIQATHPLGSTSNYLPWVRRLWPSHFCSGHNFLSHMQVF